MSSPKALRADRAVLPNRGLDAVQQHLIAERLLDEVEGALLE
jgi:hypothetical protein